MLTWLLIGLAALCEAAQPNTFPDGFPPIPLDGYPTWDMRKSTVVYFVGNDTVRLSPPPPPTHPFPSPSSQ